MGTTGRARPDHQPPQLRDAGAPAADLHASAQIPPAAQAEVERLLRSGDLFRYASGAEAPVARLEAEFAAHMGVRFALAVNSCSAALFLALKALDLAAGARVMIPAFTFAAVPSAVIHAGCTPVLVEVGDDLRIDMEDFRAALERGAEAVMISHMRGHTSDMDRIMAECTARGLPVIEDAAHSLGALWSGQKIGTIGRIGCFSFQSYKLVNAGEGGMLITDDAEIAARAVIMSGAYEHNWQAHPGISGAVRRWQNRLPLYNMRMQNLSAAVIRPQIPLIEARAGAGRAGHDQMTERLSVSPHIELPAALPAETRAPDSLQFLLRGLSPAAIRAFPAVAARRGAALQIFGLATDNARAFWNWQFLGRLPALPKTRAMLMRTCDLRLPAHLPAATRDGLADAILAAVGEVAADQSFDSLS